MNIIQKIKDALARWKKAKQQINDAGDMVARRRAEWDAMRDKAGGNPAYIAGEKIIRELESSLRKNRLLMLNMKSKAKDSGGDIEGVGFAWVIPAAILAGIAAVALSVSRLYDKTVNDSKRLAALKEKISLVSEGKAPPSILENADGSGGGITGILLKAGLGLAAIMILPAIIARRGSSTP